MIMVTRMNLQFRYDFTLTMVGVYPSPKLMQGEAATSVVSPFLFSSSSNINVSAQPKAYKNTCARFIRSVGLTNAV